MTRQTTAWVKTLGFQVDARLLKQIEDHREHMDAHRPEGAAMTPRGEAIRNLILAGLEAKGR